MATELKVNDLEISCYSDMAMKWSEIDSVIADYISILNYIMEEAVISGEVHDAIENLKYQINNIYQKITGVGERASGEADSFLGKIETVDLELYKKV